MKNKIPVFLFIILIAGQFACNKRLSNNDNPTDKVVDQPIDESNPIDDVVDQSLYKNEPMDKVVYRFRDSSTPPKYHRSYTITITPAAIRTVVDVYGTILADTTTHTLAATKFEELKKAAATLQAPGKRVSSGATGTKGYRISLYQGSEEYYQLYWDSMQGIGASSKEYVELIKSASPELSQLLRRQL